MPNQNDEQLARARARAVVRMYLAGDTYRAIGEAVGVSKQRAHQIISGHPNRAALFARHRAARVEARNRALYRTCAECGTGFINHTRGRKFCGPKCRRVSWQRAFKKGANK